MHSRVIPRRCGWRPRGKPSFGSGNSIIAKRAAFAYIVTSEAGGQISREVPEMNWRSRLACAALAFGIANAAAGALAQSPVYRKVFGGDFIQRYVADGELIEIRGHGWAD